MNQQPADCPTVHCARSRIAAIGELRPHPQNPNTHPPEQVALYADAIRVHGWRRPITVSTRSGFVVRGHGALLAAQSLGLATVPVEDQQYQSESEELADLLADNRLSELGELDEGAVAAVLRAIHASGNGPFVTGYQPTEVAELMAEFQPPRLVPLAPQPPPALAWALVGVPITEFGEVQALLDKIGNPRAVIHTTFTDAR